MTNRKRPWLIELVSLVALLAACSTTRTMMSSGSRGQSWTLNADAKVPAAQGTVRVASGSDGNQTVDVEVRHLAPPDKVFEGTSAYVIWLRPAGGGPAQNVGVLAIDGGLKGHLTTKTAFRDFEIVITAEAEPNGTQPSNNRVMDTSVRLPA